MGHALVENRHGLLVDFRVSTATGKAEREVAIEMLDEHDHPQRTTRGLAPTRFGSYLIGAAYNLLRITNLRRQLAA